MSPSKVGSDLSLASLCHPSQGTCAPVHTYLDKTLEAYRGDWMTQAALCGCCFCLRRRHSQIQHSWYVFCFIQKHKEREQNIWKLSRHSCLTSSPTVLSVNPIITLWLFTCRSTLLPIAEALVIEEKVRKCRQDLASRHPTWCFSVSFHLPHRMVISS